MDVGTYFERFTERDWQVPAEGGPVRFAVVGLGWFARNRALPAIREAEFCEASVLVSGSPGKADETATAFGVDRVLDYDAFREGESVDAYDAAYLAVPNALHRDYAVAAARNGKHVLCEKPLAATVEGAEATVAACEDAGVTLMVAYRMQTEPAARRMREMIRDGFIGDPVQIHSGFSSRVLEIAGPDQWRLDADLAGGGAMMDLGIYPLNTVRFLLDEDPTAVAATTSSPHEAFDEVDEHVAFQLTFPDGVTASCTASFDAHPDSRLQILGTEGKLVLEQAFGGDIPHDIVAERGDMCVEYTGPPVDEIVEEFDYFANHVLSGRVPEPDGADGLADVVTIDAVYEAATMNRPVEP